MIPVALNVRNPPDAGCAHALPSSSPEPARVAVRR